MITPSRPNASLFLMADEHRADVVGFAGDPVFRTPVLDELALPLPNTSSVHMGAGFGVGRGRSSRRYRVAAVGAA